MLARYLVLPGFLLELAWAYSNSSSVPSSTSSSSIPLFTSTVEITSLFTLPTPTSFFTLPAPVPTGSGNSSTNGTGLDYASSCNSAKLEWVDNQGQTYVSNTTFTTSTSSVSYTIIRSGWIETYGPTEVYTLCDGVPRVNASTEFKTTETTPAMTIWSTFATQTAVYRNASAPTCTIGPKECNALKSDYSTSLQACYDYLTVSGAPSVACPESPICGSATLPPLFTTLAPAACMYNHATIQLLYWPVSTVGNHICGNNWTTVEATPTIPGQPNTAVGFNTTFTSPTVYMVLSGAYEVGSNFATGTAINGILPMPSDRVSSMCALEGGGMGPPEAMDYADFDAPIPASKYRCQPACWTKPDYPQSWQNSAYNITATENLCSTIYDRVYRPALQVPIEEFNSFYGNFTNGVGLDFGGLQCSFRPATDGIFFDPPSALQQVQSAVGPSVPNSPGATTTAKEDPQTTPASPGPTVPTALPQTTGGGDGVPQPTQPSSPDPPGDDDDDDGQDDPGTPGDNGGGNNGGDGGADEGSNGGGGEGGSDGGNGGNNGGSGNGGSGDGGSGDGGSGDGGSGNGGSGDGGSGDGGSGDGGSGDGGSGDGGSGEGGSGDGGSGDGGSGDGGSGDGGSNNNAGSNTPSDDPPSENVGDAIASLIGITRPADPAPAEQTPSPDGQGSGQDLSNPSDPASGASNPPPNDGANQPDATPTQGVVLTDSTGQTLTAVRSGDALVLPSTTVPLGQATSIAGLGSLSADADGIAQNGQTVPYQPVAPASPSAGGFVVDGQTFTADGSGNVVVAPGVTVSAGGAAATVAGTTFSLAASGVGSGGGGLVVDGVTATASVAGGSSGVSGGVAQQTGNAAASERVDGVQFGMAVALVALGFLATLQATVVRHSKLRTCRLRHRGFICAIPILSRHDYLAAPPINKFCATCWAPCDGSWNPTIARPSSTSKRRDTPIRPKSPFNGFSVPDEVTRDPADSQIYAELAEHLLVAPGREPDTLVVFPINLDARDREDGERVSESYLDEDDAEHVEHRLDCARRIYAHLFADGAAHPRIASYRGPTATGYKLQRLRPGPLMHMAGLQPARTSAKLLALYQRWAVQVLSALVFLHSKGVILNTISDEVLWLRDDLSIAIAGLVDAACSAVGVPAACSAGISCFGNPWEATNHYTPEGLLERSASLTEADTGCPKKDLFDWATWVYSLMTHTDPDAHGLETMEESAKRQVVIERWEQIRRRKFDWPTMEEEMLGSVVARAWQGAYATAGEALEDARRTLESTGTAPSTGRSDELGAIDWRSEFALGGNEKGGCCLVLREE